MGKIHLFWCNGVSTQPDIENLKSMIVCSKAYRAHLVGKAHKKKEAQAEGGPAAIGGGNAGQKGHLYCQLCEVTCSSSDAYAAHIRGAKHQKVGC